MCLHLLLYLGFLISVICQEEIQAVLLAIGFFFPNFLLAGLVPIDEILKQVACLKILSCFLGMVWPIQGMPIVLQYIAYLL